jgi:hypothetical protein
VSFCSDRAKGAWEDEANGTKPASFLLSSCGGWLLSLYCCACAIFHGGGGDEDLDEDYSDERDTDRMSFRLIPEGLLGKEE